ncbi:TIR domain-containing protein [Mesorhizobium sp. M0898]|uniref:nSTAND1 domain-containing NTPase n=1 Tax=Mesorhizobium sp. M0898 TaxID=2957020 RepID=UPI00333BE47A
MPAIFVSHSSQDSSFARQIKDWLAAEGYEQVFLDFDNIQVGEHWEKRLYEEIVRCHAVILVLTPAWLDSKWCFVEFTQARALGKAIFPVVVSPLGSKRVAPEIQGIDLDEWNASGQERLRRGIKEITDLVARGFVWDRSRAPYPGIYAFDYQDAAVFFGRDTESREVIERLEARRVQGGKRLLLIVGASGSGKSSLLRAGILPQLVRQRGRWIAIPPFRPERSPLTNLAKSLAQKLGESENWRDWKERLQSDALSALRSAADKLRVGDDRDASILVPIDQFEENFTIGDVEERSTFLAALHIIADPRSGLPYLAAGTVRSDVLGDLLRSRQFVSPFDEYGLRNMKHERIVDLIEGPAGVAALLLERGLAQRIAEDVHSVEALPILAFALRELYERCGKAGRLTISDYQEVGDPTEAFSPIEYAVRRRADDVIAGGSTAHVDLAALKNAFIPHMVHIRDDGTFVRQPALLTDLPAAARPLIEDFVSARLLSKTTLEIENEARTVVEVSHESLFKAWPLLAGWLNEERAFLIGKAQLARALADWKAAARGGAGLLQGLQLARARRWLHDHRSGLSLEEAAFIRTSWKQEWKRRLEIAAVMIAALIVIGTVGTRALLTQYAKRTASQCDLLAADVDNNVFVPGVEYDRIDFGHAIPACEAAVRAEPNNPRLMYNLGRAYDRADRYRDAAEWYRWAANLNWVPAENNLAVLYLYGRGVPMDIAQGVSLLRKATAEGNGNAAQGGIVQAEANYYHADFSNVFGANPTLSVIIKNKLVEKSFLVKDQVSLPWGVEVSTALENFKRSESIADNGLSLRVLDRLGVIEELSAQITKTSRN